MKHILNVVKTESPQRRLKPDTNISTKMCKTENEIITVRQSSGLASCFSTILYFYIKAKEEFNNFVFARIDGAEVELLRKRQRNLTLGCMMVSPVYITLYLDHTKKLQPK